ncbi:hypothetical protein GCM10017687_46660 [Streptomyces echinatus]
MVIGAVVAWGVAIAGFGLSGNLWVAVLFLAAAGVADMVSMVFRRRHPAVGRHGRDGAAGCRGCSRWSSRAAPRLADVLHGTAGAAFGPRAAVAGRRSPGRPW